MYQHLRVFPTPRALPVAQLQTATGPIQSIDLAASPGILFFGFTRCPDICPLTLATLAQARRRLAELEPTLKFPQVWFISVDPERDSAPDTDRYAKFFAPDFRGVSAPLDVIAEFTRQMGIAYHRGAADEHGNYTVDHSGTLVLVGQGRQILGVLPPPHDDVNALADDLGRWLRDQQ